MYVVSALGIAREQGTTATITTIQVFKKRQTNQIVFTAGGDTDTCCRAACYHVPCPTDNMANETTACAAKCPQGDGSPEETAQYAACEQACFKAHFFTDSATPSASAIAATQVDQISASSTSGTAQATGTKQPHSM